MTMTTKPSRRARGELILLIGAGIIAAERRTVGEAIVEAEELLTEHEERIRHEHAPLPFMAMTP
jgi:hypothetical protein